MTKYKIYFLQQLYCILLSVTKTITVCVYMNKRLNLCKLIIKIKHYVHEPNYPIKNIKQIPIAIWQQA